MRLFANIVTRVSALDIKSDGHGTTCTSALHCIKQCWVCYGTPAVGYYVYLIKTLLTWSDLQLFVTVVRVIHTTGNRSGNASQVLANLENCSHNKVSYLKCNIDQGCPGQLNCGYINL